MGATCNRMIDCTRRYCRCTCPCLEFFNPCLCVCIPDRFTSGRGFRALVPGDLPEQFQEFLRQGQLLTALILCSNYSEKYRGREMVAGNEAPVKLPDSVTLPDDARQWDARLLARFGRREATPFIWRGDGGRGDDTLYVVFGPLRNKRQYFKLLSQGTRLETETITGCDGTTNSFQISAYMKAKLDDLWLPSTWNFGAELSRIVAANPGCRILFAGISHGGALAQAAALKFVLQEPTCLPRVFVISWNAYKWTDNAGSVLAGEKFGEAMVPLVLSKTLLPKWKCCLNCCCCCSANYRRWDSVPEFPPGFSPMPHSLLLDVESGTLFGNLQLGEASFGITFATRLMELHFANTAIGAMKIAMSRDRTGRGAGARRHWQDARRQIRHQVHRRVSIIAPTLSLSLMPNTAASLEASHDHNVLGDLPHDDSHDGDSGDESSGSHDAGRTQHGDPLL